EAIRAYDPRYSLVRNHADNQWEVWRENEDGRASRSYIWAGERLPAPTQVLDWLLRHDTWKGYDPLDELDRLDREREARIDAAVVELAGASADKLHRAWVDEFSAHMPAARPIYLGAGR